MTKKKRKIILIGLAVTLALAVGVGGFVYAENNNHYHDDVGGNKLLGVGEMGYEEFTFEGITGPTGAYVYDGEIRGWDTQFIVTNPNCDKPLYIEWVALIAGEDASPWEAEQVLAQGTPGDWHEARGIHIPGNDGDTDGELSPHEVWQVSIAELLFVVVNDYEPNDAELYYFIAGLDLNKYTLEVTWSGAHYRGWWWWGYWRSGRPLTGWQKEKCRYMMYGTSAYVPSVEFPGLAISEAEMKVFPSRTRFESGEPYFPPIGH